MQFDVVIGNPPYNGGQYKNFITLFNADIVCMITPANWQYTGDYKFNQTMINLSTVIKYYPLATDIFPEISQFTGISIFCLNKNKNIDDKCKIYNISSNNKYLNNLYIRSIDIDNNIILYNIGFDILNKIKDKVPLGTLVQNIDKSLNQYYVNIDLSNYGTDAYLRDEVSLEKTEDNIYKLANGRTDYGYTSRKYINYQGNLDEYKLVVHERVGYGGIPDKFGKVFGIKEFWLYEPTSIPVEAALILCKSTNKQEVLDFYKWVSTKFIRFLFFMANTTAHFTGDSAWRFAIEKPAILGSNYTSNDIYTYFNLSQSEINCIEYTMKDMEITSC